MTSRRGKVVPMPQPHADLRSQLETARLELRALFRALDELHLMPHIPDELHALFELDADFAEALWVLEQPEGRFDLAAMMRDTRASLEERTRATQKLRSLMPVAERRRLDEQQRQVLSLRLEDAYGDLPGGSPVE